MKSERKQASRPRHTAAARRRRAPALDAPKLQRRRAISGRTDGSTPARDDQQFRSLFEHMLEGFAYCRMVYDVAGRACDFVYLDVNAAFGSLTGLKDVVGKPVTEVIPDIRIDHPELFDLYSRVAETGNPERLVLFFKPLSIWLSLSVYSPAKGHFVAVFDNITQRMQAEESLRRRTEELQVVMESVPAAVFVTHDADAQVISGNRAARTMVETPPGINISKTAPPGERPAGWQEMRNGVPINAEDLPLQRAARGEEIRDYEMDLVFAGGPVKSVQCQATPLQDEEGHPRGAVAVLVDVTAQKRAEELLARNAERFRLLSDITARLLRSENPQAIVNELCTAVMAHLDCQMFFNFLMDDKARRLNLNAYAGVPETTGRELEWLDLGVAVCGCVAECGERIIAEDIQHTQDPRTELVKSFGAQAYACHPLYAQGKLIGTLSFGTTTRPYFKPDEITFMRTVTDQVAVAMQRLRAEEALRLSEERYRVAVKNAPVVHAQTDRELRYTWIQNPHPDYDPESIIGKRDDELEDSPFVKRLVALKQAVLESGRGQQTEMVFRRSDGLRFYDMTLEPLRDAEGNVVGVSTAAYDITERRRAEEEREELHRDLERRAIELEATNKELEAFTYAVAHDLRGPLNLIEQFSKVVREDYGSLLPEHGQHLLHLIRDNSAAMNSLAEDLLTLTRMNQHMLKREIVSMTEIVDQILDKLPPDETGRDLEMTIGDLPLATGDPHLITQLWENLIANALKFTQHCPNPHIEIDSFEELGRNVYFVRDNGVGFNMAHSDRLFRAFQRLHHPEDFEGNGLGLAIVERIVRRHGGRVWAQAAPDQGATFYFTLG